MACMLLFYAIYFMTLNIVNTIESNTMQLEKHFTFFSLNSVELETSSVLMVQAKLSLLGVKAKEK